MYVPIPKRPILYFDKKTSAKFSHKFVTHILDLIKQVTYCYLYQSTRIKDDP